MQPIDKDFTPVEYDPQYILMVNQLKKYFPIKGGMVGKTVGQVKAVDGVTFNLKRGTTMGLVGESGCGKTTTGRTILRLSGEKTGGQVLFNGKEVYDLSSKEMREMRTKMQIIFQDPFSSLSPRLPVGEIIGEAVREHNLVPKAELNDYIDQVMDNCGLQPFHKDRYPHEFSGGQRQRICIARALALNPEFVVCDEPVSALDVSIQAQIINLLKELQEKYSLTYLFISHDLSVVEYISDTVGVMYLGNLVEYGTTEDIFRNPLHPYTEALFSAIPIPDPEAKMNRIVLEGSIPSPANPPEPDSFYYYDVHRQTRTPDCCIPVVLYDRGTRPLPGRDNCHRVSDRPRHAETLPALRKITIQEYRADLCITYWKNMRANRSEMRILCLEKRKKMPLHTVLSDLGASGKRWRQSLHAPAQSCLSWIAKKSESVRCGN